MALTYTSQSGFVSHTVIKGVSRLPEEAEWAATSVMIPNARGYDSAIDGYAGHLPQPH